MFCGSNRIGVTEVGGFSFSEGQAGNGGHITRTSLFCPLMFSALCRERRLS